MNFFTKVPRYPGGELFPCVSDLSNIKCCENKRFDIRDLEPEQLIAKCNLRFDGKVGFYTGGFFDEDGLEYSILCTKDFGPFIYLMDADGKNSKPLDPYEDRFWHSMNRFLEWLSSKTTKG